MELDPGVLIMNEERFCLNDVANEISEKLIRRHPHVFGQRKVTSINEVRKNWELIKYSPPHSTWRTQPFELADYPNATDQQKRLMAPPSVQNHPPVIEPGT